MKTKAEHAYDVLASQIGGGACISREAVIRQFTFPTPAVPDVFMGGRKKGRQCKNSKRAVAAKPAFP